ncbi:MAG: hypothetical protein WC471_00605 [Candidatus Woesearchaeota archaeon]
MFNKRGAEYLTYFMMIDIMLLLIVTASFGIFISNLSSSTTFERSYLARDIALLQESIYASPGDLEYSYQPATIKEESWTGQPITKIDLQLFDFGIQPDSVKVMDTKTEPNIKQSPLSYYAYNPGFNQITIVSPEIIYFTYRQNQLSLGKK